MKMSKLNHAVGLIITTFLLAVASVSGYTRYVLLDNPNAAPPYTNWATAAGNIQDAVNVAATSDVVLVTNEVYPGKVHFYHRDAEGLTKSGNLRV